VNYKEAKEIEELDLNRMHSEETNEQMFQDRVQELRGQFPSWDEWGLGYWAVTMMRVELAVCGLVQLIMDGEEPRLIIIIGRPDYSS